MNLNDIISLAKQGYKPSDIKELISLASDVTEQTPPAEMPTQEVEPDAVNVQTEQTTPAENEQVIDYKLLYEETQSEVNEMKSQIEKIQKDNTRANMQGETPSAQETLNDIVKSFM